MKKIILGVNLGIASLMLGGCGSPSQVGTVAGAAAGAGIGYAVSGGTALGTAVGAGAGALVGHSIGHSQERHRVYRNGVWYYY